MPQLKAGELIECPLCKSENVYSNDLGVQCKNCQLFLGHRYSSGVFHNALTIWNTRADHNADASKMVDRDEVVGKLTERFKGDIDYSIRRAICESTIAELEQDFRLVRRCE